MSQLRFSREILLAGVFLSILFISGRASAQSVFGVISGSVADTSGATVPGASVVLLNQDTATDNRLPLKATARSCFRPCCPADTPFPSRCRGSNDWKRRTLLSRLPREWQPVGLSWRSARSPNPRRSRPRPLPSRRKRRGPVVVADQLPNRNAVQSLS